MTTTAEPQHEAEPAARSPADATAATTVEEVALAPLERVPEPLGGDGVVGLGGVHAGGLEAVQAEWGRAGGTVVLAGRRPFVDVTARAAFGPDGTVGGRVEARAVLTLLGLALGEVRWAVDGWSPTTDLALPSVSLAGTALHVDVSALPDGAVLTAGSGAPVATDAGLASLDLPGDVVPPGEPLSPRLAEVFRGLLGVDLADIVVHRDTPVAEAPAFVSDRDLFFAPGRYGADDPETLRLLDAALRSVLAGVLGPVGTAPPAAAVPEDSEAGRQAPEAVDPVAPTVEAPPPLPAPGGEAASPAPDGSPPETGAAPAGAPAPDAAAVEDEAPAEPAPPVEVVMPPAPTEPTPAAAARGGAVAAGAGGAARAARDLPTAAESAADARGAVTEPVAETAARAREDLAGELGERPAPSPEIVQLVERIRTAIANNRPEDQDELLESDPTQEARSAGGAVTSSVEGQVEEVSGSYDAMSTPPAGSPALSPTPVTTPGRSSAGMGVDAASAAPDPVPSESTSLDVDVAATDQRIADSGMETRVTAEIPDGPFQAARDARGELGELAQRTPEEIRAEEQAAIDTAQADMARLQQEAVAALRDSRGRTVDQVGGGQGAMTGQEELTRDSVSQRAQTIYADAERRVTALLTPLSRTAMGRWEAGLARSSREFHDSLDRVQRWIEERHSGVVGSIVAIGDYVAGLPRWVTDEYNRAERQFGNDIGELLLDISSDVNGVVAVAQAIIRQARTDIGALFDQMEAEFPEWAAQERARFDGMLDGLAERTTEAQTGFVRDVSRAAITAVNEAHAAVEAKRQEAGGLIGRVVAAIEEFIDDPVRAIINGLLRLVHIPPDAFWALLAQIQQVVADIAADPENFLNNLVAGVKLGFQQFFDHFGTHLLTAFWQWLFSGLETPIPLPAGVDPLSLFTFALQLMGITWPRIREILVRHIGPTAVEVLEAAWQLISVLVERGPGGWSTSSRSS